MCIHPFSLDLSWSSESLCLLLLVIAITEQLGGDWELGDHPAELVDDPSHDVSGCGRFTAMECQRISRREHLALVWIKGELHPCVGAPTRTSGEWRLVTPRVFKY